MDTKTLSALIESLYAASVGACSWHAVVTDVASAFGERGGILYEFDAGVRQSQVLGSTPVDPALLTKAGGNLWISGTFTTAGGAP